MSCSITFDTGLLQNLVCVWQAPATRLCLSSVAPGLQMLAQLHLAFYMGAWDLNSGLVFKASASPLQSSFYLFLCLVLGQSPELDLLGKLYAMKLHPQLLYFSVSILSTKSFRFAAASMRCFKSGYLKLDGGGACL